MMTKTQGVPGTPFTIAVVGTPGGEWLGARYGYEIHEGDTYPNSDEPRPTLTVTLSFPEPGHPYRDQPEVSWPSTSDKRPALARALAVALEMAAERAERGPE